MPQIQRRRRGEAGDEQVPIRVMRFLRDVVMALGGLPESRLHFSSLAATALHSALDDYRRRQKVDLRNWRSQYER